VRFIAAADLTWQQERNAFQLVEHVFLYPEIFMMQVLENI
jgi:hypothetical protein